ncbi:MAG: serine/threonine protein kinase [Verrucomicrobia bacterium]|nr:serine/threonine protein kinase [Verrucomicrobiota bacterium]
MTASHSCPECGAPLGGDAPAGLCPRCLLAKALAAGSPGSAVGSPPGGVPTAAELAKQFSDLEVRDLIARGGMGAVYRAWQKSLHREVALKILPSDLLQDEDFLDRFQREARLMARLDHPNVARVFDAGITDAGSPYLVMEIIDGAAITDYCNDRQLGLRARLNLFLQVCDAVQHAHQKGIIHRDLKPSNILVAERDDRPAARVIDFGLARPATDPGADDAIWRSQAHAVGTPAYMSPEQAAGADVDTRSDVYSLGVLLYELLTGRTPFDDEQLRGASRTVVQRIIRETPISRPSARIGRPTPKAAADAGESIASAGAKPEIRNPESEISVRDLRGDLDAIILKAMAKNTADRYSTVAEFAEDVDRYLRCETVTAVAATAAYRTGRFLRRHRVAVALTTTVALALIAGLVLSLWQTARAQRAEQVARRRSYYSQLSVVMRDLKEGRGGRFQELLTQPEFVAASKDFPGWEWPLLHALADRSLAAWPAHVGGVTAVAATRD